MPFSRAIFAPSFSLQFLEIITMLDYFPWTFFSLTVFTFTLHFYFLFLTFITTHFKWLTTTTLILNGLVQIMNTDCKILSSLPTEHFFKFNKSQVSFATRYQFFNKCNHLYIWINCLFFHVPLLAIKLLIFFSNHNCLSICSFMYQTTYEAYTLYI